jgi:hypothetical protein
MNSFKINFEMNKILCTDVHTKYQTKTCWLSSQITVEIRCELSLKDKIEQIDIPLKNLPFSQNLNMIWPVFTQKMSLLRSWSHVLIVYNLCNKAADRNLNAIRAWYVVRRSRNKVFGSRRFAIVNSWGMIILECKFLTTRHNLTSQLPTNTWTTQNRDTLQVYKTVGGKFKCAITHRQE